MSTTKMVAAFAMVMGMTAAAGCGNLDVSSQVNGLQDSAAAAADDFTLRFWERWTAPTVVIAPAAPPPPRVEVIGVAPSARHFWVHGYWRWTGRQWTWIAGHWDLSRDGFTYVQPHWEQVNGYWRHIPGRWVRS